MFYKLLLVFIGAGAGGCFRFIISHFSNKWFGLYFPVGTLMVNIIGSFILGIIIFAFDDRELLSNQMKLLLAVGFCGGITTFSTFSYETIMLLKDTQFILAAINILLNVVLTIAALYLSFIVSK